MKQKTIYTCQQCGYQSPKWLGKCPDCQQWNTLVEETPAPVRGGRPPLSAGAPLRLAEVAATAEAQWQVSKTVLDGVTLSSISVLDAQQRVEEIARMLGGVKITDTTRKHAAEMLGTAA